MSDYTKHCSDAAAYSRRFCRQTHDSSNATHKLTEWKGTPSKCTRSLTHGALSALAVLRSSARMYHAAMRALLWNSKSKAFLERDMYQKRTWWEFHKA